MSAAPATTRAVVVLGVIALAFAGYLWLRSSAAPKSSPSVAAASSTQPAGAPQLDRKRRDEVRRWVYQRLGQPLPTTDVREKNLPPSPGVLDKNYIQSRIRSDFIPLALQCYASLLTAVPDARGKAVVSFVLVGAQAVGGIVESAELVEGTTLDEPEFATCLRESLLSVVFEPPQQGGWVTVTYPFDFAPEDPDEK